MALGAGASWAGAVGSVGNLVGAAVDGIASFFGVKDSDPLGDLKKFASTEITQKEVDQVELNAKGVVAYAKAMTALAGMEVGKTVGDALGGIVSGIGSLFGGGGDDKKGPIEGLKNFAALNIDGEKIKKDISSLLSILEDKNVDLKKSWIFKAILTNIGDGLRAFTAPGSFVDSLAGAATKVLSFLTGDKSPIQQIEIIASKSTELKEGAAAIGQISDGLDKMAKLQFDGSDIKIDQFAKDLVAAIPLIEGAIMGGTVDPPGLGNKVELKGLASGEIKWEEGAKNIAVIRKALGLEAEVPKPAGADKAEKVEGEKAKDGAAAGGKFKIIETMNVNTLVAQTLISNAIERNAAARVPGDAGYIAAVDASSTSIRADSISLFDTPMANPDPLAAKAAKAYTG